MLGKLQNLLDKNLIAVAAKQFAFSKHIGKHSFKINRLEGLIRFNTDQIFAANVIGTESFETDEWTWAWSDTEFRETPLVKSANKLRKLGIKQELTVLTRKRCALDTSVNGFTLACIATDIAKADCFYSFKSEGDTRTYILLNKIGQDTFDTDLSEELILHAFEKLMPDIKFDHYASLKYACEEAGLGELVKPQKISLGSAELIFDTVGNCLDIKRRSSVAPSPMQEKTTRKHRRSKSRRR